MRTRVCALELAIIMAFPGCQQADRGVRSTTGLVVSTSALASDAGAAALHAGGNAVDAAVATAFALAVTHPSAGNIGGGGFIIVRKPDGALQAYDFREKAPMAATREMYLDAAGRINRRLTEEGYLAPGVPGTVRGLEMAHKDFGRLPWRNLVMPAVQLAEKGFVLSESLARSINRELDGAMGRYPESVEAYGKPGGGKWTPGDRIFLKDLGRSLRSIAEEGPDVFYRGWIANRIAEAMRAHGGLITREDLERYEARRRTPLRGSFRGCEIISMPPPSSGGVALIEMLQVLEHFDLKGQGRYAPQTLHLMTEAMRRAYLDRARFLGDPDFTEIPVSMLVSRERANELAATIDPRKASSSADLGRDIYTPAVSSESEETTHFSVLDRDGMAVAQTYTLEGGYGSKVVVRGAGFLLNNEMGDFNKKPGETNARGDIGTAANAIAPGKRMLSSMTPTMVTRDGRLLLVTGSPGGRTIINTVLCVVLGVVEFGMDGRQAVDSGRMHHQWFPETVRFEQDSVPAPALERLKEMGHTLRIEGKQGDAHSIWIDPRSGVAYGANDRRSADSKASVP